jgi:hypothetical protein
MPEDNEGLIERVARDKVQRLRWLAANQAKGNGATIEVLVGELTNSADLIESLAASRPMTSSKPGDTRNMRRLGETEGRAIRAAIAKQRPMTSNVVPADDDLVERLLTNALYLRKHEDGICRLEANCLDEAASRIASLSSELARCREQGQAEGFAAAVAQLRAISGTKPKGRLWHEASLLADSLEQSRIPRAALNPIGEEGAREP